MLNGAVIYARDMELLVQFYKALGFDVLDRQDGHTNLGSANSELMIIQAPAEIVGSIDMTVPAAVRTHTPIKLVFNVPSIEATAQQVNTHGGRVDRGQARWDFGDFYVQDAVDPEGNILQLREPKT